MANLSDYLIAAFTGFVSGFLVSIPVGPINISIVNEGARRGFRWAFLIGLGATIMEVIYCAIAFAGFTHLFDSRVVKATMELVSFLLMLFLGFKYLFAHSLPATTRSVESFEHRLHPHTAFWTGFVRCLANPYYEPKLQPLTGRDLPVVAFLEKEPAVERMYRDIERFVGDWLPEYARDNRNYLTVAIGCTGGRHRSVYLVERLAKAFRSQNQVLIRHRELG